MSKTPTVVVILVGFFTTFSTKMAFCRTVRQLYLCQWCQSLQICMLQILKIVFQNGKLDIGGLNFDDYPGFQLKITHAMGT